VVSKLLPAEFSDLERWVDDWSLPTERERYHKRVRSTLGEIADFYAAMFPRMESIMGLMKLFTPEEMPDDVRKLFYLALSFMMVSHPVELNWGGSDVIDAFPLERFEFLVSKD
jgi:hypothetical protein